MSNQQKGEILYQGHASVRITTPEGKVIYVDPFEGEGYDLPADLILVTHHHFDHDAIHKPARKEDIIILDNAIMHPDGKYLSKEVDGIRVEAVEAYNHKHKKEECVGYLISVDGTTIYIPGDTAKTNQMASLKDRNIDVAFLPVDGFYTMTPEEAEECAELIQAKTVIPYHTKVGEIFNLEQAQKFHPENVKILKNGETLTF